MNRDLLKLAQLTADLARNPEFAGKRLADLPGPMRAMRYKWRWRFYRLAEANFVVAIWNVIYALVPANPFWWLGLANLAVNIWGIHFCERRARICTRQLHRPAVEQMARDLLEMDG